MAELSADVKVYTVFLSLWFKQKGAECITVYFRQINRNSLEDDIDDKIEKFEMDLKVNIAL